MRSLTFDPMKSIILDTLAFASTFAVAHYVLFSPFCHWWRNYKLHHRAQQLGHLTPTEPTVATSQSSSTD